MPQALQSPALSDPQGHAGSHFPLHLIWGSSVLVEPLETFTCSKTFIFKLTMVLEEGAGEKLGPKEAETRRLRIAQSSPHSQWGSPPAPRPPRQALPCPTSLSPDPLSGNRLCAVLCFRKLLTPREEKKYQKQNKTHPRKNPK